MAVEEIRKIGYAIPIIASIILLAVISVIVIVTFQEIKPTINGISIINESVLFSGGSVIVGADNSLGNFQSLSTTSIVINNGTNFTIRSNNWDAYTNGSIILKTGAINLGLAALTNTSYDYNIEATSYYYNITKAGGNTFQNITKQLPLFGTIIILIAVALIALGIFAFFGGRKKPL